MRYLHFSLYEESFGVPLEQVREVIAFPEVSPIPGSSKKFLGITNLRSEVLPIIDLRITFGMVPTLTHDTAIIVCEFDGKPYGVVVDCIHNVVSPDPSEIKLVNDSEWGSSVDFVGHIVCKESQLTLILDMKIVLKASESELKKLETAREQLKPVA